MDFATLAVIALVGIAGPVLATPARWRVPVVLGELAGGIALGRTGIRYLHPDDPTFTFLADVGFALVMFVAGSHLPARDPGLRRSLPGGTLRAAAVGLASVPVALGLSHLFGTGHAALYAVLLASSSAAFIVPVIQDLKLSGPAIVALLPQVAIADAAGIVALPLVIDPHHAARAALGALAVIGAAAVLYLALRELERSGRRRRVHKLSERRKFALELRINLLVLFALAAVATRTHVSIMLAGFSFGLVISAIGEPRRLARQLFAITDGFLGPLFFVWLGATLDLRELGGHPTYIALGLALGVGAVAVHVMLRVAGQPVALSALAAAQVGVPVAAATLGSRLGLISPQEAAALMLGAVVTIGVATLAAAVTARRSRPAPGGVVAD